MSHALLIDWLSITVKQWPGTWPFFDLASSEMVAPRYGYKSAFRDYLGVVAYQGGNSDSLHIVYSGSALNELRNHGWETRAMLQTLLHDGAKVTRIDLACDWQLPNETVANLHALILAKKSLLKVQRWSFLESENEGQTLYIGSRSSDRMLRIYNKRAQLARMSVDVEHEWIRIEAELKDAQAQLAANALLDNEIGAVLVAHILRCVDFPTSVPWITLLGDLPLPAPIMPSVQGRSNTDEWLLNTVLPILKRRLESPEFEAMWSVGMTG